MKRAHYIKSAGDWGNSYVIKSNNCFRFLERISISRIKRRKKYRNKPSLQEVNRIVLDFYPDAWEPVMINERFFLIDGQHRLLAARKLGLSYIDVIVVNENKLKNTESSN